MKKTKFTEQQIACALKQAETGTRVDEVCRKMGFSEATFYNWKKKYGGLGVHELRRLLSSASKIGVNVCENYAQLGSIVLLLSGMR